jgi:hypothetical protein
MNVIASFYWTPMHIVPTIRGMVNNACSLQQIKGTLQKGLHTSAPARISCCFATVKPAMHRVYLGFAGELGYQEGRDE